jgi:hypothetical protein
MKALLIGMALAIAAGGGSVAAASWGPPVFQPEMQSDKGRRADGQERSEAREPRRLERPQQRDERREHAFTEDERRALHRDIDKANRELYRRRGQ